MVAGRLAFYEWACLTARRAGCSLRRPVGFAPSTCAQAHRIIGHIVHGSLSLRSVTGLMLIGCALLRSVRGRCGEPRVVLRACSCGSCGACSKGKVNPAACRGAIAGSGECDAVRRLLSCVVMSYAACHFASGVKLRDHSYTCGYLLGLRLRTWGTVVGLLIVFCCSYSRSSSL